MSDAECIGILERTQDPLAKLDYAVDFEAHNTRWWQPGTSFTSNTKVRSASAPGLQYSSSGGYTGAREPRWPTSVGGTVVDGSITWTAEAVATTSLLRTLSSAAWTADTGITLSGAATSGQVASTNIDGGTDGQTYVIVCTGTMSDGLKQVGIIRLKVERKLEC